MCVLFKNKKGVSEIVSFILLTLLIVVSCLITYVISKNVINDKVAETDLYNSKTYMKKISQKITEIQNFDDSSFSINVNLYSGDLIFNSNQVLYQSLVEYNGNDFCFDDLCHSNINGFEKIYLNISNSYTFDKNFTLSSGSYLLLFKNIKNESKIQVTFK